MWKNKCIVKFWATKYSRTHWYLVENYHTCNILLLLVDVKIKRFISCVYTYNDLVFLILKHPNDSDALAFVLLKKLFSWAQNWGTHILSLSPPSFTHMKMFAEMHWWTNAFQEVFFTAGPPPTLPPTRMHPSMSSSNVTHQSGCALNKVGSEL